MGHKGNKKSWFSSIVALLLCGEDGKTSKTSDEAVATSGPEASIVASSKHFSSAHKVQFN